MNLRVSPPLRILTLADLIHYLDDIPAERIRLKPTPGTATEADVLAAEQWDNRLCELVDGVLVEKAMGFFEGRLAAVLIGILDEFVRGHDLGIVLAPDATMRLMPGLVRMPDVSFVSWARLPGRKLPAAAIPDLMADLAIEVLSKSNTAKEMQRKLREYFAAGARQVWFVDGDAEEIRVYTSPKKSRLHRAGDTLRGGKVLPGFTLAVAEVFERAGRR